MKNRPEILNQLSDPSIIYDIVVVGGGITGAGVARDAASRGLKVLLLEKGDFSSGTSSKSGKLIHGGFRYLKDGHFKMVFESCKERYLLYKVVAPHLVGPVRFYFPFFKSSHTPKWMVACGLALYDFLSLYRFFSPFSRPRKTIIKKIFPGLVSNKFAGALSFYDGKALDFRLVIDTLKATVSLGGQALNYCEVLEIEGDDSHGRQGTLLKITCADKLSGKQYSIKSHVVVNASGPWADKVLERSPSKFRFNLHTTSGIHFIVDQKILTCPQTLALEHPQDHRPIYLVPWGKKVLIGTTDQVFCGNLDRPKIEETAVLYLLQGVNHYFPHLHLQRSQIERMTMGVRSLMRGTTSSEESKIPRDFSSHLDPSGLASITGGKLTTYRIMAKNLVDKIMRTYFPDRPFIHSNTAKALEIFPSPASLRQDQGQDQDCFFGGYPLKEKEIFTIVQEEWVEKLSDLIFRRTEIGWFHLEHLEDDLPAIGKLVCQFKGWNEGRLAEEIADCWKEVLR